MVDRAPELRGRPLQDLPRMINHVTLLDTTVERQKAPAGQIVTALDLIQHDLLGRQEEIRVATPPLGPHVVNRLVFRQDGVEKYKAPMKQERQKNFLNLQGLELLDGFAKRLKSQLEAGEIPWAWGEEIDEIQEGLNQPARDVYSRPATRLSLINFFTELKLRESAAPGIARAFWGQIRELAREQKTGLSDLAGAAGITQDRLEQFDRGETDEMTAGQIEAMSNFLLDKEDNEFDQ